MKRVKASQEVLGIYLSCLEDTDAYNLPTLIPIGNHRLEEAREALGKIFQAHPQLNSRFQMEDGVLYQYESAEQWVLNKEQVDSIDRSALIEPFPLLDAPLYRFRFFETPKGNYFFCDFHHALMDGFSLTLFYREFAQALEGKAVPVEKKSAAELAAAQEASREEKAYAEEKKYFEDTFGGVDVESLPTQDKDDGTVAYARFDMPLKEWNDQEVAAFMKRTGIRRSSFFLASAALTLGLYSFSEEVAFAFVDNGRDADMKNSYGMFVRTLPFYVNHIDQGETLAYVQGIDAQRAQTIAKRRYSFLDLVKDTSFHPEVLVSYQGDYYYQTNLDGKKVDVELIPVSDGKEKITFEIFRRDGAFFVRAEYRSDLYEEDSIRHLISSIDHFGKELLSKEKLEDMDPCGEEDIAILDSYNQTDLSSYDFSHDFVDDIRDSIANNPNKPAVICGEESLTYAELGDLSDRIADYLIGKKFPKQSIVSILVGRNLAMGYTPVGVLKAGLAYQPLDPSYPDERLAFMMEDASAKLLICQRGLESKVASYQGPILFLDEVPSLPLLHLPQPKSDPHDLYIMLYTSGSTGKPKGVQLEHHNISAFTQWQRKYFDIGDGDNFFAYASFGFDANMYDLYGAITNGNTLVVVPEDMRLDLPRLNQYLEEHKACYGVMTTQVGRQFAESQDNHSLKSLCVGGEKLVPVAPPKSFELVNGYGPTECTIVITMHPVDRLYYRVPIGKALPITHTFILDKKMRRLPYGAPGFLFASGHQVGRGYLNRPEENAKAFIDNPFETGDFAKMYNTGDVVRYLKDGTLDFIGRKDGQVKIRGFRIETSEVERVLREYPGIKDATVQAFPAASGGMFIAGYFVADTQLDIDDIKRFIGERKPPYMVPEAMMQLDAIPLNQNSKVNKRALPVPTRQTGEIVAPSNPREKAILALTKKLLGYEEIGVTTDLFEAGLTSISSIRYMGLLSSECGLEISMKELREHSTVRQLAALQGEEAPEEAIPEGPYPLTKTQQGIFVEMMAHPASTIYNIPLLYKLDPSIDLEALEKALKTVIDAHPGIKAHLQSQGSDVEFVPGLEPAKVERIQGDPSFPFELTPYDLFKGPLYQAKIYQGKNHYLYLDTHHIASDGSSLALMMAQIGQIMGGESIEPELKGPASIAYQEQKKATAEELEKEKAHYESFLRGVDSPSLPRKDYELPTSAKPFIVSVPLTVDAKKVAAYFKANGINPNGFFNAVFAYALSKWNGNDDALFTSIYSGRDQAAFLNTVTMLVKTLPVYAICAPEKKRLDFVKEVQAQLIKSQENTLYSFAEVSHEFGVKAEVMFAYQGDGFLPDRLGKAPIELLPLDGDEAKAPFSVDCLLKENGYLLNFEAPENLYRNETMTGFAKVFDMVAKAFLEEGNLGSIAVVDEADKKAMDVYNATEEPLAFPLYLDYLAREVAAHPQQKMIIGVDETLTYEEFDVRTNQIANALLELQVKPDEKVVTLTKRIANAFVAREGVLKSGAAFLPIDPAYPDDRIGYIIEDAGARFVLTTKDIYEKKKEAYPGVKFLLIEDILQKASKTPVNVKISPQSLAYCIYTSGSTGKPKGVMIEHHSLANLVDKNPHNYVVNEYCDNAKVTVALASLSFDLSIQEEFVPFANGLTTVMASEDEILNPVALAKRMLAHKVDILTTTPSYVNNLLEIEAVMEAFRNLKAIDLGAEAIPASLIQKMKDRGMKARAYNGYGPTEATVTCTMDEITSARITIGFPDANVKTYIIDKELRRLPLGAVGELLIGGEGVARGYIHRDDLNKEKFIQFEGVYAYRSGDLARINYDGRIEFFGRKDNQVKLRGLRVELDEIENNMTSYPGVSRAVVLVKETAEEGQFLVGYYLSKEEIPTADFKAHLAKSLTPYMIPKVFVHLDTIPMTQNGKVDKKALPEPTISREKSNVRLPRNETQRAIYDIFAHVLGVKELSIDDDFFDLGGTSLSASKVAMLALEKKLPISYGDIFDNPTVTDLAALVKSHGQASANKAVEEEVPVTEGVEYNVIAEVDDIQAEFQPKRALLTGATGFLGIHIFRELIQNTGVEILALIRGGKGLSPNDRLATLLAYYFGDLFEEEIAKRVRFIESDVTAPDLGDKLRDEPFDLIINCAAVVKHFSNDDSIERVNLGGVKNLIEVALAHQARLVQISTLSVAGENINGKFPDTKRIHENEIFFGQDISNKYVHSKIKAEEALIEAVNQRGLDGKVIRVGNLMGRERDGEFQVNSGTNSFMNSLRAYVLLGCFPVSAADATIDFSPIDEVAKTVLLLSSTPKKFTLFHSANSHEVEFGDVLSAINGYGYKVDIVRDEVFQQRLAEFMKDETKNMAVSSLISYDTSSGESHAFILSDNSFSIKALYRLGYKWPITDRRYLERSIESLATLGFFDGEDL
ncbi:MAG: amino acid adenylation domain-containing protein [Bacilli bacterium]|nr:amino acid adenylation domain-containing protein [Bacilli bacterium]